MSESSSNWLRDRRFAKVVLLILIAAVNIWFDLYHPIGWIIDGVLVFVLIPRFLMSS